MMLLAARIALAALAALLVFTVVSFFAGEMTIEITEKQINDQVEARLPFQKSDKMLGVAWDAEIPELAITFSEQALTVEGKARGGTEKHRFQTDLSTTGDLVYRDGELFYAAENVELSEVQTESGDNLAATVAEKGIGLLKGLGVGDSEGDPDVIGSAIEGSINKMVAATARELLSRVPVYTLPDSALGGVAKAAVSGIKIADDKAIVTLSLWQLTKVMWGMILAMVATVCLIFGLASMGGWGIMALIGMGAMS